MAVHLFRHNETPRRQPFRNDSAARRRTAWPALCAAALAAGIAAPAHADITIDPTYGPSIASVAGAETAINAAIGVLEADITTPITVNIYFQEGGGLGESESGIYLVSYYDYYNALQAIDTGPGSSPGQQSAFASLGAAPADESSPNPVNGGNDIALTAPIGRALGFDTPAAVLAPNSMDYDTIISLNTSITSPPKDLSGNYGLEAVATHEIDEALGIGGTGSAIDQGYGSGAVGDMDLFRYSAPGVRSYSDVQTISPYAYFSVDGGNKVISYFNQTAGADYGDWLSNPIPAGFAPQVQDAYGDPGTDPALGASELCALNVIGYAITSDACPVPEPMSLAMLLPGLLALIGARCRAR